MGMMTPSERQVENKFVAYVRTLGLEALKLRIDGKNGWPDRSIFLPNGKAIFFEFKTPEGRERAMQTIWKQHLLQKGFEVHTPRSFLEAKEQLTNFLEKV